MDWGIVGRSEIYDCSVFVQYQITLRFYLRRRTFRLAGESSLEISRQFLSIPGQFSFSFSIIFLAVDNTTLVSDRITSVLNGNLTN